MQEPPQAQSDPLFDFAIRYSVTPVSTPPRYRTWVVQARTEEEAEAQFDQHIRAKVTTDFTILLDPPRCLGIHRPPGLASKAWGLATVLVNVLVVVLKLLATFSYAHEVLHLGEVASAAATLVLHLLPIIGEIVGMVSLVLAWGWNPLVAIAIFLLPIWIDQLRSRRILRQR